MSTAMDIAATSTTIEPPLFDSGIEPLEGASGNTARTILVALCVDASTREKALRNYYRLMHYEQQLCGQEIIRNASAITTTMGSTKRKAVGEPKICLQCDEIFTEDQNQLGACWYHSGELELMDESAIDREPAEMALYDLDTEPIRARHPEAFRWCCCRKTGKARGCTPGRHEKTKAKVLDLARKLKHQETLRQVQASAKPARPLAICVECREAFDPNTSGPRDCFYHPGYLEVDDEGDFWADHDEDCHGKIDTDEMREAFPDGFRWDCCGQTGDAEGCHRGSHRSDQFGGKYGISADQQVVNKRKADDNFDVSVPAKKSWGRGAW
ncbi:hypothetical protein GCG54_00000360 [Colletotrichum gloeosporioides]|uniref:Uncharacterized protein n=1 Tax=Colletotrichum gloeosporioides TaxID=474922 RepID=A0A8H4CUY1_COLGL|nr:uncharacterized protein GCG54_00000360 [Colletotrichum gloeosporioides]KAF3810316.1 hypothetical protein GCG54_00000360 [Colletotrichum gloeosporioides]